MVPPGHLLPDCKSSEKVTQALNGEESGQFVTPPAQSAFAEPPQDQDKGANTSASIAFQECPATWNQLVTDKSNKSTHKKRWSRRAMLFSGIGALLSGAVAWEWQIHQISPTIIYRGSRYRATTAVWSPDDRLLASGSADGLVQIWNSTTGRVVSRTHCLQWSGDNAHPVLAALAWSPDGAYLASAILEVQLQAISKAGAFLANCEPALRSLHHSKQVEALAWSPDSQYLASSGHDQTLWIWQRATSSWIPLLSVETVSALAWSPDGDYLAIGSYESLVTIYNTRTRSIPYIYSGHTSTINTLAWSPDSQYVASGSDDQTVQIWHRLGAVDQRRLSSVIQVYREHKEKVQGVSWSPDGRYIASGGWDQAVRIWSPINGQTVALCSGPTNEISSVAWSHKGRRVAAACKDASTYLWQLDFLLKNEA